MSKMKTIGIIGGMSYESSLHYYERINAQVNQIAGDLTSSKMLIYNVNFQEIRELMLNSKWDKIGIELATIAKILENAGADYIAIATNTMHKVADYIQENPQNHVLYRVTPIFQENNLVANGIQIESYSIEDKVKGICWWAVNKNIIIFFP